MSEDVIADLSAALMRLKQNAAINVKGKFKINLSTVCKEAGRHRSAIKKHPKFDRLREEIRAATEVQERERDELKKVRAQFSERLESLKADNANLEQWLEDAGQTIFRLHFQLKTLEDDREYILARVADARKTSRATNKVFEMMNFDELIARGGA